jgi:hypothetical protein
VSDLHTQTRIRCRWTLILRSGSRQVRAALIPQRERARERKRLKEKRTRHFACVHTDHRRHRLPAGISFDRRNRTQAHPQRHQVSISVSLNGPLELCVAAYCSPRFPLTVSLSLWRVFPCRHRMLMTARYGRAYSQREDPSQPNDRRESQQ